MLRSDSDPKIRKSALVQVNVMLTDSSLHEPFLTENGLTLILDIFSKALVRKNKNIKLNKKLVMVKNLIFCLTSD